MRHIICFGNPLHGDDGFGHMVYQRLTAFPIPEDLRLFDAGTSGLHAIDLLTQCDDAVLVDAIAACGEPGRLHFLQAEQLIAEASPTSHGFGIAYLLQMMRALGEHQPRIQILGVEAGVVAPFQPGLSPAVASAVDEVVDYLRPYFGACANG